MAYIGYITMKIFLENIILALVGQWNSGIYWIYCNEKIFWKI